MTKGKSMKTSVKILLTTAGVLIAIMVTGITLLKNDARTIALKSRLINEYGLVSVEPFDHIILGEGWDVKVSQGRAYQVEIDLELIERSEALVKSDDGILHFMDALRDSSDTELKLARVTVPKLRSIEATKKTKILLRDYITDTLSVNMNGGGDFSSKENQIEYLSFKSSGESSFEWLDDPYQ